MKYKEVYKPIKCLPVVLFLLAANITYGQDYPSLISSFSRPTIAGTARSSGAAGAFGSVGADLGSFTINPAGLGLYRSSDFSITPGIRIGDNDAKFNGSSASAKLTKFYLAQGGVVWTKVLEAENTDNNMSFSGGKALRTFSLALNYQRQNFFSRNQNFNGSNNRFSMIDYFAGYGNYLQQPVDGGPYPLEMILANATGLLNYNAATNYFTSNVKAPVNQIGQLTTRGAVDKIDLGFGANIRDKLYFGFSLGIPILSYNTVQDFTEANANQHDSSTSFQSYSVESAYSETGVGFTGSLGLIYRPFSFFRLGASYHLPSFYSLNENYSSGITSYFDTIAGPVYESGGYQPLHYNLRTPMHGVVSTSFYLKQNGFLSIDYEFQNLGSTKFKVADASYQQFVDTINAYTKLQYGYQHTIRIGIEGAIKVLRLRAGYAYSSSPFKKDQGTDGYKEAVHNASAGIGVRLKNFYFDFAYVFSLTKDAIIPLYTDQVTNNYVTHNMVLTLGWKISKDPAKKQRQNNYTPPPVDPSERY